MKLKYIFLFTLATLLITTSCKSKKGLEATTDDSKMSAANVQKRIIKNQLKAEWLVGRAKISLNGGSFAQSGTAELRIRKDSVIWMSVRKFGIEAARALITKDSVFLLDRFNRKYAAEDLSFISEQYNLPASFGTLQAIFLGNPIFIGLGEMQLDAQEEELFLSGTSGSRKSSYVIQPTDYRMKKMIFEDTAEKQTLTNGYQDYRALADGQNFSYFRTMDVESASTGKLGIQMEFSKVEVNVPSTIRFEIPKQYTRME